METPPSGGFPSPALSLDFTCKRFRRRYAITSPPSDGVTLPNRAGHPPGALTGPHKDPAGIHGHGGRAFFAVPCVLGPPDGPPAPSTSGGDLNKGLLSRPSAPSARTSLTVCLRRRTQKFRSCVLDIDVEVVPCCGRSGHVRHVDPPAPERHDPSGIHGTLCQRR